MMFKTLIPTSDQLGVVLRRLAEYRECLLEPGPELADLVHERRELLAALMRRMRQIGLMREIGEDICPVEQAEHLLAVERSILDGLGLPEAQLNGDLLTLLSSAYTAGRLEEREG